MATNNINPCVDLVKAEVDSGSHIQHVYNVGPGVDVTNGVMNTGEAFTAGTLVSGADGATITGLGILGRLTIYNGSASAITVEVYDNTSATGTKLTTTIPVAAGARYSEVLGVRFSLGVYLDFSTATSCQGMGYWRAG